MAKKPRYETAGKKIINHSMCNCTGLYLLHCTATRGHLPVPILIQVSNQPSFLSLSHHIFLQQQLS